MGYLFLDIESLIDLENERTGLNPFYDKSKVIVISYNYYQSEIPPTGEQIKSPVFLYEWVIGSEKEILTKFFEVLRAVHKEDKFLKLVGFNHVAYDMPFLLSRMLYHKVAPEIELFDLLFSYPRHVDLSQLGMAISEDTKRDEDFRCISQKKINSYFEIPVKQDSGKDVSIFYHKKRFDMIERYCSEEFTFELLYKSMLDYFLFVK